MIKNIINSKVFKNSSWIILGKMAQLLIALIVGIFIARYLGPQNYGIINTAQSYTTLFLPICSLGFSGILAKVIYDDPKNEGKYLGTGLVIRIFGSLVAILAIQIVTRILNPDNKTLKYVSLIYSCSLLFQNFDLFDYWYQSKYQSKYSSIIGILGYLAAGIYKIILLVTKKNVIWFAFSNVLDYMVIALIYMSYTVRKNKIKLKFSLEIGNRMLNLSKHLIIANLLVVLYGQMDKIMIGKLLDSSSVGLYSVSIVICSIWTFILSAIINSLRPNIIELHKSNEIKYKEKVIQLYAIVFWLCVIVSIIIFIFSPFIIKYLYGDKYLKAVNSLRIVSWYTGFSYLGVARNIWIVCEGKQRYEKYFAISGICTNFILNYIMIPSYGIEGAAIASLLTQAITNIVVPYIIKDTRENIILIFRAFNIFKVISKIKN